MGEPVPAPLRPDWMASGDTLQWGWARDRLVSEENYWVATVQRDGRPRARPAWGVWMDELLFLSIGNVGFPNAARRSDGGYEATVHVDTAQRHFADLVDELEARSPVLGVVAESHAVSVCFCARRSEEAAEAGLQTAEPYRGRGQGPRVTAAWARAIRATGRMPLYSTSWTNAASLAVARKVGLVAYALDWTLWD